MKGEIKIRERKYRKVIAFITISTTIITAFNIIVKLVLPRLLSYKLNTEISDGKSIGIIGGADGSTAIYISELKSSSFIEIVFALIAIAGILYFVLTRRTQK